MNPSDVGKIGKYQTCIIKFCTLIMSLEVILAQLNFKTCVCMRLCFLQCNGHCYEGVGVGEWVHGVAQIAVILTQGDLR